MSADVSLRDHYCFGCGHQNPIGLHLTFERDGHEVVARYEPRPEDQGFPGMMHGGLVAVLLDEAMGWAMYIDRIFAVTAKMETRYRRSATLDVPLEARARLVRASGRRLTVEGRVRTADGVDIAEASALFVRMSPAQEAEALAALDLDAPDAFRTED
ncbi:MAG: PaaI family thioesterase [Dehalococcoidia bacterium]